MANFNLNQVTLGGRITADPELQFTPSNNVPVTSFTIAVNRKYQSKENNEPQADFFRCVAWRKSAEFVTRYFRKGSSICVTGYLQTRSWADQHNVRHEVTEVIVNEAHFVDSKDNSAPNGSGNVEQTPPQDADVPDDTFADFYAMF